ncbi:MAG TPA: hypothetical protein VMW87_09055 [Spirochaetia bacterium]|nr:hypothetical protein [Spirochaetia bacterium]
MPRYTPTVCDETSSEPKSPVRVIGTFILAATVLAASLLLTSCPQPIDQKLLSVTEDKLPPTIALTSPVEGAEYFSTVVVSGTIKDSALQAGDNAGALKSITFVVPGDSSLNRTVAFVGSNFSVTPADSTFSYNSATGAFQLTLDTINLRRFQEQFIVTAVDANGNQSQITRTLTQSSGILITPDSSIPANYTIGEVINLTGTISNSAQDTTSASELASLSWSVVGKLWGASITNFTAIASNTFYDAGTGNFTAQNQEPNFPYDFVFNPATRTFTTSFFVLGGAPNPIIVDFHAVDKNGIVSDVTRSISLVVDTVDILVNDPSATATKYYSHLTNQIYPAPTTPGYFSGTLSVGSPQVISDSLKSVQVTLRSQVLSGNTFNFTHDFVGNTNSSSPAGLESYAGNINIASIGASSSGFSFPVPLTANGGQSGALAVTVTVTTKSSNQSFFPVNLTDDATGPAITGVSISSDNTHAQYAKNGDTVTLAFTCTDSLSGLNGTPVVTIDSVPVTGANLSFNSSTGAGTATYVVPVGHATYTGTLSFSISASDNVGNASSYTNATQASNSLPNVTLYAGVPDVASLGTRVLTTTNTNNSGTSLYAKNADTVTLKTTPTRTLASTPVVTMAAAAAGTVLSAGTYTSTRTMNGTETQGPMTFVVTAIDMAGNTGPVSFTTDTAGDHVTLDSIPPAISSVTIAAGTYKVGSIVPVIIHSDGTGYLNNGISINGQAVTGASFVDNLNNTYTANYTVAEGDIDRASVGAVPISIQLKDPAGNPSATYTTAPTASPTGAFVLDAHSPTVASTSINYGTGVMTVTLSESLGSSTQIDPTKFHLDNVASGSVHNVTLSAGELSSVAGNVVTFQLSQVNRASAIKISGTSGGDGTAVVLDLDSGAITDNAGNPNVAVTGKPVSETADSTPPTISSITAVSSPASGTIVVGDTIVFTLTPATQEPLGSVSGSYNGASLSWATSDNGQTYTATYTVAVGDPDQATPLQISGVVLKDAANNSSSAAAGTGVVVLIDATPPKYVSASLDYNSGLLKVTFTKNVTNAVATKFHIGENGSTNVVNLTSGEYTSTSGATVNFMLSAQDRITALAHSGKTGGDGSAVVLNLDAGAVKDTIASNPSIVETGKAVTETADNTPPSISTFSSTVTPSHSGTLIIGDKITFTLALGAAEPGAVITPTTFNGRTISWTTSDNITFISSYTVTSGDPDQISLALTVTATDTAGNPSSATDLTAYAIDANAPVISSVTSTPSRTGGATLIIGDTIDFTVTLAASESGAHGLPTTYNGGALTWATSDNTTFTATYTVVSGQADHTSSLKLTATVQDSAGNTSSAVTDSTGYKIDANAPTASATAIATPHSGENQVAGYYNSTNTQGVDVTVTYSDAKLVGGSIEIWYSNNGAAFQDAMEGVASVSTNSGSTVVHVTQFDLGGSPSNGTLDFKAIVTDAAGNVTSTSPYATLTVDKTLPTLQSAVATDANHSNYIFDDGTSAADTLKLTFDKAMQTALISDLESDLTFQANGITAVTDHNHNLPPSGVVSGGGTTSLTIAQSSIADVSGDLLPMFAMPATGGTKIVVTGSTGLLDTHGNPISTSSSASPTFSLVAATGSRGTSGSASSVVIQGESGHSAVSSPSASSSPSRGISLNSLSNYYGSTAPNGGQTGSGQTAADSNLKSQPTGAYTGHSIVIPGLTRLPIGAQPETYATSAPETRFSGTSSSIMSATENGAAAVSMTPSTVRAAIPATATPTMPRATALPQTGLGLNPPAPSAGVVESSEGPSHALAGTLLFLQLLGGLFLIGVPLTERHRLKRRRR